MKIICNKQESRLLQTQVTKNNGNQITQIKILMGHKTLHTRNFQIPINSHTKYEETRIIDNYVSQLLEEKFN